MASDLKPVYGTEYKHDPGWKHCQMYRIGRKVQLKCIYCEKVYKGGVINSIKQHLAWKGSVANCLRVPPDVRLQMLESLEINGVEAKMREKAKREKLKLTRYHNTGTIVVDPLGNNSGLKTDIDLLPVPELLEHNVDLYTSREDIVSGNASDTIKEWRIRKAADVADANATAFDSFQVMKTKKISDPVYMAVGRFFFDVGLPAEAVNSAYFKPMVDAIASQGVEAIGPSFHDLRSWMESRSDVDKCRRDWEKNG